MLAKIGLALLVLVGFGYVNGVKMMIFFCGTGVLMHPLARSAYCNRCLWRKRIIFPITSEEIAETDLEKNFHLAFTQVEYINSRRVVRKVAAGHV